MEPFILYPPAFAEHMTSLWRLVVVREMAGCHGSQAPFDVPVLKQGWIKHFSMNRWFEMERWGTLISGSKPLSNS